METPRKPTAAPHPIHNDSHIVKKILVTSFIDFLAFAITLPILPFVFSTDETGLFNHLYDKKQLTAIYGALIGCYSLAAFFGAPLLGAVSDRVGRRKVLLFANGVNVVGYSLVAMGLYTVNLYLMFLGRLLPGLIGTTLNTVQAALADVSDEQSKAKNFGITGVAFGLGFVSGVLLVVVLTRFTTISYAFAVGIAAILNLVNMLYLTFILSETLPESERNATLPKLSLFTGFKNLSMAFKHPIFRPIFSVLFLMMLGFAFFTQFFQYYLMDNFGMKVDDVGLIFVFIGVVVAITQGMFLPRVANRFLPQKILPAGILLFALSYILLLLPTTKPALYAAIAVMIFFQGITFPSALALVSNMADRSVQGEILGINQSIQSLVNALPPILFGALVGLNVSFPIYFGLGCSLAAWALYMGIFKKQPQRLQDTK